MSINQDNIIRSLELKPFGQKGWWRGKLYCPTCGKNAKFATLFTSNGGVCHCFVCAESTPLKKILRSIGREDLLSGEDFDFQYVETLKSLKKEEGEIIVEEVNMPIGFKRIKFDPYLESRKFTPAQYKKFGVGIANLDPRTENKIIFTIYQKNIPIAWLARSRHSKHWHELNLKEHKEAGLPLVLRYRNSENDFSKILGGVDEITSNTHTLILVEGLFDKTNLDRLMDLDSQEEVKCCFTFGSDISINQVDLIPLTVENIILMYDANTIKQMKISGGRLISLFNVRVALIKDEDIDPGNMNADYLSKLFANLIDYLYFYNSLHR